MHPTPPPLALGARLNLRPRARTFAQMSSRIRVQFIHGLESNPHGTKARFLAEHFDATAPAMDTRDFEGSVAAQAAALASQPPDVVIGSSFGGAVAVTLLARGLWRGPTVLLAPAAALYGLPNELPAGVTVTVVHGTSDAIVPLAHSRALAATGTAGRVRLVELEDEHRLQTLVDSGALADLVRETFAASRAPLPLGALTAVRDVTLAEPYCYLSALQAAWCERSGLGALVAHLPCWAPQRVVSVAAFGDGAERAVDAATERHGPWVWATEFANVHTTFRFEEPGFVLDGVRYAGPESYFQLAKSEGTPDHAAAAAAIAASDDPDVAFRVGRTHAIRPDWEAVKMDVMRAAVTAKFTQDEALRALLLATGGHPLVQLKPHDAFWGTGSDGRGRNALGALLMELRGSLDADVTRARG